MVKIALVGGYDSQLMLLKMRSEEDSSIQGVHFNFIENSLLEEATLPSNCDIYTLDIGSFGYDTGKIPNLTGRDLLFCNYVCMYYDADEIYIGHITEDLDTFSDISLKYADKLSDILSATYNKTIKVKYPLAEQNITKSDLEMWAKNEGIDTTKYVSCFSDNDPCGRCIKCVSRWAVSHKNDTKCNVVVDDDTLKFFLTHKINPLIRQEILSYFSNSPSNE